ncbi:hypothetical protein [Daejeonella sp.]|uniref:hypothetical protein n=1 Tax=Daejeonella sp. TaxID=2805397 RepID=UPI0025C03DA2|nr:hypothetical protein [Daejeonella sp.]
MQDQVLFVYNAKSDLWNKAFDFMHKIISPQTYNCNLCALTFDNFSERKEWTEFRSSLSIDFKFLYSDNFENEFPREKTSYPVVYLKSNNGIKKLISSNEINTIGNIQGFMQLIKDRLHV